MDKLTRDGVSLSFEDVGRGAPPILLIHDLGRDHTALRPQFQHLRRRHRVVAVDLPGHGQSDPLPQAYTLPRIAEHLAWLCYELGVYRPVAIGHGTGGLIAVALAAGYPDLLAAVVTLDASLLPAAGGNLEVRATTSHLAAMWQNTLAWDFTSAPALCDVPTLYLTGRVPGSGVHTFHKLCSHLAVESIHAGHLDQGAIPKRVSAAIDAFLDSNGALSSIGPAAQRESPTEPRTSLL